MKFKLTIFLKFGLEVKLACLLHCTAFGDAWAPHRNEYRVSWVPLGFTDLLPGRKEYEAEISIVARVAVGRTGTVSIPKPPIRDLSAPCRLLEGPYHACTADSVCARFQCLATPKTAKALYRLDSVPFAQSLLQVSLVLRDSNRMKGPHAQACRVFAGICVSCACTGKAWLRNSRKGINCKCYRPYHLLSFTVSP